MVTALSDKHDQSLTAFCIAHVEGFVVGHFDIPLNVIYFFLQPSLGVTFKTQYSPDPAQLVRLIGITCK